MALSGLVSGVDMLKTANKEKVTRASVSKLPELCAEIFDLNIHFLQRYLEIVDAEIVSQCQVSQVRM